MSDDVETLTLEERKNAVQTQLIKVFGENEKYQHKCRKQTSKRSLLMKQ